MVGLVSTVSSRRCGEAAEVKGSTWFGPRQANLMVRCETCVAKAGGKEGKVKIDTEIENLQEVQVFSARERSIALKMEIRTIGTEKEEENKKRKV